MDNFDPTKLFDSLEELDQYMATYAARTGTVFLTKNSKLISAAKPRKLISKPDLVVMYKKFSCEYSGVFVSRGDNKKKNEVRFICDLSMSVF